MARRAMMARLRRFEPRYTGDLDRLRGPVGNDLSCAALRSGYWIEKRGSIGKDLKRV